MQDDKKLLTQLEATAERKVDKFGVKWFRYPGDTFFQSKDIDRIKLVERLLITTTLSENQIIEKIKVELS